MTARSDLTTDIISWTGHNLSAPKLSSIIRLAESNIGRDVRIAAMYQTDNAFAISATSVAVPTGLIEVKRFRLDGRDQTLKFCSVGAFYDSPEFDRSGVPEIYTIEGGNFVFAPTPVGNFTALLGYLKRFTALVNDVDTNALLNDNYDIYLFACLAAAFAFAQDDEQAQKYLALYRGAVDALNISDQFTTRQGNKLRRIGGGSY